MRTKKNYPEVPSAVPETRPERLLGGPALMTSIVLVGAWNARPRQNCYGYRRFRGCVVLTNVGADDGWTGLRPCLGLVDLAQSIGRAFRHCGFGCKLVRLTSTRLSVRNAPDNGSSTR